MKKAVFLDRDGTINVDKNYIYRIEDFEYIEGAIEGLKLLQDNNFILVVITNQSGIARGYFSEEQYLELNDWMLNDLSKKGIYIAATYYCPHHPAAKVVRYKKVCSCRKPGTELFERAIAELDIDTDKSFAIGDRERDLSICDATGVKGFLLNTDSNEIQANGIYSIQGGLLEAAERIVRNSNGKVD